MRHGNICSRRLRKQTCRLWKRNRTDSDPGIEDETKIWRRKDDEEEEEHESLVKPVATTWSMLKGDHENLRTSQNLLPFYHIAGRERDTHTHIVPRARGTWASTRIISIFWSKYAELWSHIQRKKTLLETKSHSIHAQLSTRLDATWNASQLCKL